MINIEKLKSFFCADKFVQYNDIKIEQINEDYSVSAVILNHNHYNAGGVVQGGLIFTLADFAFAIHANRNGMLTVSQSCNISYLAPPKGKVLQAKACPVSCIGKTIIYTVSVTDELGTQVAFATINGFIKGEIAELKNL